MKTKILLTGKTGFIGKNVLPFLESKYDVIAPLRGELNLFNKNDTFTFVKEQNIETILHFANPNPVKNSIDEQNLLFKDSLRIFTSIISCQNICKKIYYLGSGAEYDKRFPIENVSETQIGNEIPTDDYGFSKYLMHNISAHSTNIFNLRLFACFGPFDHSSKFITHVINCCKSGNPVTIRQDCWFDYLHIDDFKLYIDWFISNEPLYHDYNICSGIRIRLSDIAAYIIAKMGSASNIIVSKPGFNNEYTANNERLLNETNVSPQSIFSGIDKQIKWQMEFDDEKKSC